MLDGVTDDDLTALDIHAGAPLAQDDQPFRPRPAMRADTERLAVEGALRWLLADVYVAPWAPDGVTLRARAVVLAVQGALGDARTQSTAPSARPETVVIGYDTAAWVHAGGDRPAELNVVIAPGSTRIRAQRVRFHEHRLPSRDVERIEGLRLTTAVRTAADLARGLPELSARPWLDRLATGAGVSPVGILAQLEGMAGGRGVARGRALVHAWAAARASLP